MVVDVEKVEIVPAEIVKDEGEIVDFVVDQSESVRFGCSCFFGLVMLLSADLLRF